MPGLSTFLYASRIGDDCLEDDETVELIDKMRKEGLSNLIEASVKHYPL